MINRTYQSYNINIIKVSYDMDNTINFTDIAEKAVAFPLSTACAFDKTRNVNKLDGCIDHSLWFYNAFKYLHSFVGDVNDANIRIYSCKFIIGCNILNVR